MQQEAEKTVDIDTSGPGADIEIKEEQKEEQNVESTENSVESNDTPEKSSEQLDVRTDENNQEQSAEKKEEVKETPKQEQKKDLDDYSEGVKRRIGKLTRKLREAERQRDEATSYAQTVLADQEKLKSRLTKLDTGYVSEMENRIKSGMEAAVAKLAKAREDGDMKAEVIAQAEISKLGYEEARLSEMKNRSQVKKPQPVQQPTNQETQPTQSRDPRAEEWASKNTWFNKDLVMTEGARVIHRILTEEEGYDPVGNPEEYYAEIDRRIALEFPHKFGNTTVNETISKPTQVVASATRSPKTGRKIQRLTPSEVAIAKKLGVPLDEYAKSKRKITKEV
jgi:hypothetical protein